jgi:hypothetical protein
MPRHVLPAPADALKSRTANNFQRASFCTIARTKYAALAPARGKKPQRAREGQSLAENSPRARLHLSLSPAMDTGGTAPLTPPYSIPGVVAASATAPNPSDVPIHGVFTAPRLSAAPGVAPLHPPTPKASKGRPAQRPPALL